MGQLLWVFSSVGRLSRVSRFFKSLKVVLLGGRLGREKVFMVGQGVEENYVLLNKLIFYLLAKQYFVQHHTF